MITWDYHVILQIYGFPFKEISIVSVGIRVILDPRMRPLGLDDRNRSGTYLFRIYVPTLHLFMHGISFSSLLIPFLWTDLQMAPVVELLIDGLSYRGFAHMLYDILKEFGVPTKQVKYVCRGEPRPNGL